MSRKLIFVLALIVALLVAACTPAAQAPAHGRISGDQAAATEEQTAAATEAAASAAAPAAAGGDVTELTILWAQWDPADYLQEIGNMYEEATGIKVNVVQEPWGSFYDRAFTEFAAGGQSFDMIVGDSQWLGQGAEQGHYVDLTDFLTGEGIDKYRRACHPDLLRRISDRFGQVLGLPDRGRCRRLGLSQGPVREPGRAGGVRGTVRL